MERYFHLTWNLFCFDMFSVCTESYKYDLYIYIYIYIPNSNSIFLIVLENIKHEVCIYININFSLQKHQIEIKITLISDLEVSHIDQRYIKVITLFLRYLRHNSFVTAATKFAWVKIMDISKVHSFCVVHFKSLKFFLKN